MAKERSERQERKITQREAQREAAARRQRRNALLWRGLLVVVVLGVGVFAYRYYRHNQLLGTVTTSNYAGGNHVAGPIEYKESPPVGGPHNIAWQNCGVYDKPIHNEHGVHSLEHGAVWITYRPDLPADQVQALRAMASEDYILLSPYPGLSAPVVASAWNHQIKLDGASDPRLPAFIDQYKTNPSTTPEFGAPCVGAISTTAEVDTLRNTPGGMRR